MIWNRFWVKTLAESVAALVALLVLLVYSPHGFAAHLALRIQINIKIQSCKVSSTESAQQPCEP